LSFLAFRFRLLVRRGVDNVVHDFVIADRA
jgi:hypothetical protein